MHSRFLVAAVLGLAALIGAACSSDDSTVSAPDVSVEDAPHNDADVEFAQGMIPHHRQAVEMAQLAADRADSREVLELAERIEAAQAPEIDEMTGWLVAWGEEIPEGDGMDHGGMDMGAGGTGMMSAGEMEMLGAASGAEFDRMFLEMMIVHHEGALEMAETQATEGEYPVALALAEQIIATQQAEIDEMNGLLSAAG